ncbi:hypothetical protein GALMADRAFT_141575 [Galerina marginata CBS 339.88]|uniref:Uncharacterized protein n=1 Tax=Galerina marginata (strain CBS 339.88) TaxID=685588 RepID=A0A067SWX7_GALM3|nr:hypothetical protein GALMADRAFT_141575 [Galerina marginata CBS 339.88]
MPPKSGNERPPGARDPGQTTRPPDPVFTADPAGGPPTPTAASAAVARYSSDVPSQGRQGPSRLSSRTSFSTVTASAHGPPTSDSEMQDYGTPSESADDDEAVPKGDASASAIASMLRAATKALLSGRANVADSVSGSHRLASGVVDFIAALNSAGWIDATTGATHGFVRLSEAIMPFIQLPKGMDVDDQTIRRPFQAASTSALFPPERTAPPDVPSPPDKKGKGNADHPKGGPKPLPQPRPAKVKEVVPFQRPPPPIPLHTKPGRSQKPVRTGYAAAAAKPAAPAAGPSKRPLTPSVPQANPAAAKKQKRETPLFTSSGPSRKQVLIDFALPQPPQADGKALLDLIVASLTSHGASVKAESVSRAYRGYSIATSNVPRERDLDIIRGCVHDFFLDDLGDKIWVGLPASKSYLRVLDVPTYQPNQAGPTHPDHVRQAMYGSALTDLLHLDGPVRLVRNYKSSTTSTAYFYESFDLSKTHSL